MWLTIVMGHQDSSCAHVVESESEDYLKGEDSITWFIYIYISCTNFVSPFPIFMFWWNTYADSSGGSALSVQNNEIHLDLVQKTKKLNRLQEKVTVLCRYS